jgi:hypothetical protein
VAARIQALARLPSPPFTPSSSASVRQRSQEVWYLLIDLLHASQRGPSVAVRPHWLNALAATVNRFTGGTPIDIFVMAITGSAVWGSVLCSPSGQPVCSRCWLAVRAPGCKPELGARLLGGADSRTADAINWIFCRSSAALRGWPLACRSQIKLVYGDHHQQPQKDCRYDELDPFLVVREPSMDPVHGQPPSGYHAPPNPHPITSHGLMTEHRPWQCAILPLAVRPTEAPGLAVGAPGISARGLGAFLFGPMLSPALSQNS